MLAIYLRLWYYTIRALKKDPYAAIAQQVERILGKDEVTSSNLVSSLAVRIADRLTVPFLFSGCVFTAGYICFEVWLSLARAPR